MWIEPVTAQLMTTFSCFMDIIFSPFSRAYDFDDLIKAHRNDGFVCRDTRRVAPYPGGSASRLYLPQRRS